MPLNEVDKVEILTLQDNYIDLTSGDSNEAVHRASPVKDMEIKNSIRAEHGFSSLITITRGNTTRSMLFDFGFSADGAALNADALGVNLRKIDGLALSHGHMDHFGGLSELIKRVGKKGLELVVHPEVFRRPRYQKPKTEVKIKFPAFTRQAAEKAGIRLIESRGPYQLLEGDVFFLGEIPRRTDFEKGAPKFFYEDNGSEKWDDLRDDTSIVIDLKGKGLILVSGCAHSGIINSLKYAMEVSGVDEVFAVMGGFHLSGPGMDQVVSRTIRGLKEINPSYVIPTHCTGRHAVTRIEEEMPEKFILNMVGTKLTFTM